MDMVSSDSGCCGACTTLAGFLVVVVDLFGFLYRDAASTVTRSAAVVVAVLPTSQSMHYCINQSINQSLSGLFFLQQNCLISRMSHIKLDIKITNTIQQVIKVNRCSDNWSDRIVTLKNKNKIK